MAETRRQRRVVQNMEMGKIPKETTRERARGFSNLGSS